MTRSLTIGLLTPAWPGSETPNGIATSVYHLALGLADAGHRPVIITPRLDAPAPEGIPFISAEDRGWTPWQKITHRLGRKGEVVAAVTGEGLADAAERACREHGVEVILAEETQGWSYWISKRVKAPVVVVLHGPWVLHEDIQDTGQPANQGRAARELRAFRAAAGILAPSRNVLEAVARTGAIDGRPRAVIANAYRPATDTDPAARDLGQGILFVGRYDRHKGGDTALRAFAGITEPSARMTFVGPDRGLMLEGGGIEHLPEALARLPEDVRTRLDVKGRQNAGTIAKLRRTHGIALIASRYENLNYTMLEAMAAGQAIVGTAVGGIAEVLAHEETALLVPPDDPQAMADALTRLIRDPALAARLGAAVQARLAADFHPRVIAETTVTFLRDNGIV